MLAEEELRVWAEDYLYTKFNEEVQFEVKDALDKLLDLGFAAFKQSSGAWPALPYSILRHYIRKYYTRLINNAFNIKSYQRCH